MKVERIIPIASIITGGYFAYKGWFEYGFWIRKGPGGGFLPVMVGLLTVTLSLIVLKQTLAQEETFVLYKKSLYPVGITLIALLIINHIGLLINAMC